MKTTVDLADDLAATLKKRTALEGIPLRTAVHEALRLWLEVGSNPERPRQIPRDVGLMSGRGLSPAVADRNWEELRNMSYDSRNP